MKKIVIIPAYNEEKSIERTIADLKKNAPSFDYVIINDCSADKTLEICQKAKLNHLDLPVNLGIGGAVQTGYLYAQRLGYDVAVQFDGDGQHNGKYLEKMAALLVQEQADMVIGSRFIEKCGFQSTGIRRIGIRFFSVLIRILTGKTITDPTSGMRMINSRLIAEFASEYPKDYPEPESVVSVLIGGKKVLETPVVMNERLDGVSSISMKKSFYYMVKVSIAIIIARLGRN